MVTVHRFLGYRFAIYTNDHAPAHVHVIGHKAEAKIQLAGDDGIKLVRSHGFSRPEMTKMLREVESIRAELLAAWERIHGS